MKDKIIEKSNELFLNLGFKSVTMDEIANSLGISKKTLYKHFSNKTALIDAVTHYMFNSICCRIDNVCAQKMNPIDEMFHIKRVVMEHLKDEKSSPLYQLQKYYPAIYVSLKKKQFHVMQETIQDNLQRGVTSGLFRASMNVDFTSRIYFNGMIGIKDQQLFPLKKYSMNTLMNYYLEYHLRAISTTKGLEQLEHQLENNQL
ncbi:MULTISPECIES: TetR/AcrR family transcriptional regulator [unclassified Polaribacter]|uniref:TetR/AcrR family transcriptional regulator n=1 Tax=unclassified Polaribacter TaxID=196858 RepID=UPI0011BF1D70|nr:MULTISPECIES: TetR/AcrR family transcriptional regulator [unclassified Polaribacter]TXD52829.1 TetR/AcrR family transcriptional regulator [Polaribacter sp. IC063]TXD61706.1 TetR/AcrR family transcriptional regulator [Polaribacter sp. IC066]